MNAPQMAQVVARKLRARVSLAEDAPTPCRSAIKFFACAATSGDSDRSDLGGARSLQLFWKSAEPRRQQQQLVDLMRRDLARDALHRCVDLVDPVEQHNCFGRRSRDG